MHPNERSAKSGSKQTTNKQAPNPEPRPETALTKEPERAVGSFDYGAMKGAGRETIRHDQLLVPYLYQLQPKSAPVERGDNPLAKAGNFINTVTGKIYDGKAGVHVIPLFSDLEFVQWIPYDAGGGFVGKHKPESPVVLAAKKASTKFGDYWMGPPTKYDGKDFPGEHELVETHLWWALVSDDGENWEEVLIPFTSTKIKSFKKANSAINGYKPEEELPMFAHQVLLKSVFVDEKPSYWTTDTMPLNGDVANSLLNPEDPYDQKLLERAFKTYNLIKTGALKADDASLEAMRAKGGGGQAGGQQAEPNPDIPF